MHSLQTIGDPRTRAKVVAKLIVARARTFPAALAAVPASAEAQADLREVAGAVGDHTVHIEKKAAAPVRLWNAEIFGTARTDTAAQATAEGRFESTGTYSI